MTTFLGNFCCRYPCHSGGIDGQQNRTRCLAHLLYLYQCVCVCVCVCVCGGRWASRSRCQLLSIRQIHHHHHRHHSVMRQSGLRRRWARRLRRRRRSSEDAVQCLMRRWRAWVSRGYCSRPLSYDTGTASQTPGPPPPARPPSRPTTPAALTVPDATTYKTSLYVLKYGVAHKIRPELEAGALRWYRKCEIMGRKCS